MIHQVIFSYLDLRGECRQVKGEHRRGSRCQQVDTVQAAVGGAFGPMRLHDAFKMAAKGVQVAIGRSAGAANGDRRLEATVGVRQRLQRPKKGNQHQTVKILVLMMHIMSLNTSCS